MNEEKKNDILDKIEDKLDKNEVDYKTELLDEDDAKKNYVPTLIVIVILAIALVIAGTLITKRITSKYADIRVSDITDISTINVSDKSDVAVSVSKKKIHVDVKEIENPTGMYTFTVVFENKGKINGKAVNFKIENKSNDDVIVREFEDAKYETSIISPDSTMSYKFTVAPNGKNNTTEKNGEKYNCSFDIVYESKDEK